MSENRKQQIIDAALKRFSHYGYNKTSMNEIADDLHITKANLYYYYSDKATLIADCIDYVFEEFSKKERMIIEKYDGDMIKTYDDVLDLQAFYMKEYYMLSLHDNLDWVKGVNMRNRLSKFEERSLENTHALLNKAKKSHEIQLDDTYLASVVIRQVIQGLGALCRMSDIVTGIPDFDNVYKILESQKRAIRFIFEGKLISKQS